MMMFTSPVIFSSGNDVHSNDSELTQSREIGVKYSIYVIIKRLEPVLLLYFMDVSLKICSLPNM